MTVVPISVNDAAVAIRDAIIANPFIKRSTSDLVSEFRVDRNKLLPAFKNLTGTTIRRFRFEQLMIAASQMLLNEMPVKEVAIECGYPDHQNNFTRGFKNVFRLGPEEWLRIKQLEKTNNNGNEQLS